MSYASDNPTHAFGLDISCTDGPALPPKVERFTSSDQVLTWFSAHPDGPAPAIRLLCLPDVFDTDIVPTRQVRSNNDAPEAHARFPLTKEVIDHALWGAEVYRDLSMSRAGGCFALIDDPHRFILQIPSDDGPFCSLALSKRGIVVKGVYLFSDDTFDPENMIEHETIQSGWRSKGLQIISLPQAIAKAHARYISECLSMVVGTVTEIETELLYAEIEVDRQQKSLYRLTRTLQGNSASLMNLERRARFQKQVVAAIECITMATSGRGGPGVTPWPALAPIKSQLDSWEYEFEVMPKRIENARSTITTLIQQRNEELNLDIAESSRRMTEAAMQDSASMKTIAILTMVFLPGTAVASFFSMSMFDWSADDGNALATRWLWIFFVVAAPLTIAVLGIWYVLAKRKERQALLRFRTSHPEEAAGLLAQRRGPSDDVEMQAVRPVSKGEK
ncbi:hypothetical protein LTR85_007954 [Meristemomyces frigidus]|nr:hypothetical protein LTR85_007954 [Meristemomyces frigidus]